MHVESDCHANTRYRKITVLHHYSQAGERSDVIDPQIGIPAAADRAVINVQRNRVRVASTIATHRMVVRHFDSVIVAASERLAVESIDNLAREFYKITY